MDSIFDALARILPIVIGIIWFLRRSGLGKNRSQQKENSPLQVLKKTSRKQHSQEEMVSESQEKQFFAPKDPPQKSPQPAKETESVFAESKARDLEEHSPWDHPQEESKQTASSLERLGALPPVAQGVVWSVILDQPPALKE